jgi:cation transporter-like permease
VANVLIFVQPALSDLLPTIEPENSDVRATPERLRRFLSAYVIFLPLFAWFFGVIESWMFYENPGLPRIVRISLISFAIFHFALALATTAYLRVRARIDPLT